MPDDWGVVSTAPDQGAAAAPPGGGWNVVKIEDAVPQGSALRRGSEAFGGTIIGHLHQMAEVAHDLATAVSSGDWEALQNKYPPTGSLAGALKAGYGALNPIEVKRTPTGEVDVPATVGATLGNTALIAAPLHELFGTGESARAAPAAEAAAPPAEAAPKLTLAQKYPQTTTRLARAGGAAALGTAGSVLGPTGATAGGYLGSEIAGQWIKKYTQIPETPEAPVPSAAPAEAPPVSQGPAPTGGDWLARKYNYKDEADAIAHVGQVAWDWAKKQGYGGKPAPPTGATSPGFKMPPVREPVSLEETPPAPTARPTAPASVELDLATKASPPLPRDLSDAIDDTAILQRFRQDMLHEASGIDVEARRGTYMSQLPSGGATKGMETTAAGAALRGQEPAPWTQLSNWKDVDPETGDIGRDTKQVLLGDYSPKPEARNGSKNIYVTQEQYQNALKRWHTKIGEPEE